MMRKTTKPEPPTYWYAVMKNREDTDWGTGSDDFDKAKAMAARLRADHPEAFVLVIDVSGDPVVVEEIWDLT